MDADGDGLQDIATAFEEQGEIRIYRNPGSNASKKLWPRTIIGRNLNAPEDAVFVDLNGDDCPEVVSCTEGDRSVFVHWPPAAGKNYWEAAQWTTTVLPVTSQQKKWMFCLPVDIDGRNEIDLVLGSKSDGAAIGWLSSPQSPRNVNDWNWNQLHDATWIMSIKQEDLDRDGDNDIIYSTRRGIDGVFWLENPGQEQVYGEWSQHTIGRASEEVRFIDIADLNGDDCSDIVVAVKELTVRLLFQPKNIRMPWISKDVHYPQQQFGHPAGLTGPAGTKGVAVADLNRDGNPDIVVTCEGAIEGRSGVLWLEGPNWRSHDISGPDGIIFDRIEIVDLDQDGNDDVLTCEEATIVGGQRWGLGIVWYENPL